MKRATKTLGKHLPPLVLYKDDLLLVGKAMSQDGSEITVTTNQYEYDSIEELLANESDGLDELAIRRHSPYISVDFSSRPGVWVYASSDELAAKGIFADVLSILEPRVRRSHSVVKRIAQIGGWLGAIGGGALVGAGYFKEAAILWLLLPVDLAFSIAKHRSAIYRESRAQKKSFWARNSDQIAVALIAAFAGAGITLLLTRLLGNGGS